MVYLHFPSNMTEEEQMLQTKYQKLRRKKKAIVALKTPKQDPEPLLPLKRPMEAKDAKEMAKKLIKSGAIKVPEKIHPPTEKTTFKRSMIFERKLSSGGKVTTGFQLFSPIHPEEEVHESRLKGDSFDSLPSRQKEEGGKEGQEAKPRQGHTLYVRGYHITEDLLKKAFSSNGNIVNINIEVEKNCGFVTFEKVECAKKAMEEINGSMVCGIHLTVSFARRQPTVDVINDASSSASWSALALSRNQKGSQKDDRELVTYDEVF